MAPTTAAFAFQVLPFFSLACDLLPFRYLFFLALARLRALMSSAAVLAAPVCSRPPRDAFPDPSAAPPHVFGDCCAPRQCASDFPSVLSLDPAGPRPQAECRPQVRRLATPLPPPPPPPSPPPCVCHEQPPESAFLERARTAGRLAVASRGASPPLPLPPPAAAAAEPQVARGSRGCAPLRRISTLQPRRIFFVSLLLCKRPAR